MDVRSSHQQAGTPLLGNMTSRVRSVWFVSSVIGSVRIYYALVLFRNKCTGTR